MRDRDGYSSSRECYNVALNTSLPVRGHRRSRRAFDRGYQRLEEHLECFLYLRTPAVDVCCSINSVIFEAWLDTLYGTSNSYLVPGTILAVKYKNRVQLKELDKMFFHNFMQEVPSGLELLKHMFFPPSSRSST